MQLQQLEYVMEVVKRGSINKAAETLFVTQPNLSKAIRNLEVELGIQIFDRNNKGVFLTDDGEKLCEYGRSILSQVELISRIAQKKERSILSISAYPVPLTVRALSRFYNLHKEREVGIKMMEYRMERVVEDVTNLAAEIGVIHYNNHQSKEIQHLLRFKNLELHHIAKDTWYVYVSKHSPFYDCKEVSMHQMKDYASVRAPDDYFANLTSHLKVDSVSLGSFRPVYLNNQASIGAFIQHTDSFRFAPGWSRADYEKLGIRSIPIRNSDIVINSAWIKRKKEILSPEAEQFIELLIECYHEPEQTKESP